MRKIKFRGRDFAGAWWYGNSMSYQGNAAIQTTSRFTATILVDEETIGQFTGFFLDGVEIYEGDVLECCYDRDVKKGVVVYYKGSFGLTKGNPYESFEDMHRFFYGSESGYKVIGNIHDNPELINKPTND